MSPCRHSTPNRTRSSTSCGGCWKSRGQRARWLGGRPSIPTAHSGWRRRCSPRVASGWALVCAPPTLPSSSCAPRPGGITSSTLTSSPTTTRITTSPGAARSRQASRQQRRRWRRPGRRGPPRTIMQKTFCQQHGAPWAPCTRPPRCPAARMAASWANSRALGPERPAPRTREIHVPVPPLSRAVPGRRPMGLCSQVGGGAFRRQLATSLRPSHRLKRIALAVLMPSGGSADGFGAQANSAQASSPAGKGAAPASAGAAVRAAATSARAPHMSPSRTACCCSYGCGDGV
mmetsp:Transcript_116937/g.337953  ORF Transcript_116937/g.337953 Transcript_116937/m.337953 type:complete len:289 (-) Transcript_116937:96-962(-)